MLVLGGNFMRPVMTLMIALLLLPLLTLAPQPVVAALTSPGEVVFNNSQPPPNLNCKDCHILGSILSFSKKDLLGKGGLVVDKITAGHNKIILTPQQLTDLAAYLNNPHNISITSDTNLPQGIMGVAYPQTQLAASGGTSPYAWSISSGALPSGLTLSAGGLISGVPGATGSFPGNLRVTDAEANAEDHNITASFSQAFSLTVLPSASAPSIASITPAGVLRGSVGQSVVITGSNLAGNSNGTSVSFSNPGITVNGISIAADKITLNITVRADAAPDHGTGTLTVKTDVPGGNSSASGSFTVAAAPTLTSATPVGLAQGSVAQSVVLSGSGLDTQFSGSIAPSFSFSNPGVSFTAPVFTPTSISISVSVAPQALTGAGSVKVTTVGGSATIPFSVTAAPPPALVVSTLPDGSFSSNPILNVSGSAASTVGIQSVTVNGAPAALSGTIFSGALNLGPGSNSISVVASDINGASTSERRLITLDSTRPVVTISSPDDNATLSASFVEVTGVLSKTGSALISVNGSSAQSATVNGNAFSGTVNLQPGLNTITVTALDPAGVPVVWSKRTVYSNLSAPVLTVGTPAQDICTSQPTLLLSGRAVHSAPVVISVTANGENFSPALASDGTFQKQLIFGSAGPQPLSVSASDQAGNRVTVLRNVIYLPALLGDLNRDGKVDIADALLALAMAVGRVAPSAADLAVADVAPLVGGKPAPDGILDVSDVLLILEKAVGLQTW